VTTALVIGGGPAGLMAADTLAQAGVAVTIADKMPSVGRKFLMAGKSGLNLTKAEPIDQFSSAYHPQNTVLTAAIETFGPNQVQDWAKGLGQETFVGSTGRVFPKAMKASPLLRAWLKRLNDLGVTLQTRWNWQGWDGSNAIFETPAGPKTIEADITILALGGASWSRLGADGSWSQFIANTAPFLPANMGFLRSWSDHMKPFFGVPIKGIGLKAGPLSSRGEMVLSKDGFEGGGVYEVSREMREGSELTIDLMPDVSQSTIEERWASKPKKMTTSRFLKSKMKMNPVKIALFHELARSNLEKAAIATALKELKLGFDQSRPIDEARDRV